jgi:hypothetical protein
MVEFLAQSTDQIGGVLAVSGLDEVIVVMGLRRLLGAGGGHTGRSDFKKGRIGEMEMGFQDREIRKCINGPRGRGRICD